MNPFITTALPMAPTYQPVTYGQPAGTPFESPAFSAPSTVPNSAQLPMHWQPQMQGGTLHEAALGLGSGPLPSQGTAIGSIGGQSGMLNKSQQLPPQPLSAAPYGYPGATGGMMGGAESLLGQPTQHGLNTTQGLQGMGAGNGGAVYGQGVPGQVQDHVQTQWGQMGVPAGEGVGAYWNSLIDGMSLSLFMERGS